MAKKRPKLQKEFGARVRVLRLRANLKQRELAARCGTGFAMQRVGQIERGEMNCTLATLAALCRGLRCEPIELFLFPSTKSGTELSLPNARLMDLWRAAGDEQKQKLIRVLGELLEREVSEHAADVMLRANRVVPPLDHRGGAIAFAVQEGVVFSDQKEQVVPAFG